METGERLVRMNDIASTSLDCALAFACHFSWSNETETQVVAVISN
jgi:hypothetical protein